MGKLIGYVTLFIGLFMMLFSSYSMWTVFTGSKDPVSILAIESLTATLPFGQVNVVMPPYMNKAANMGIHYFLMIFLLIAGGRVGSLAISLIKTLHMTENGVKHLNGNGHNGDA